MVRQMSDKEHIRSQLMAQMVEGKLSQQSAAERLSLSVRQVKRLKRSYLSEGVEGLISKKRGQPSNRRISRDVTAQVIALIGSSYADFGPTFATEKLHEQHGITLSVETVRQQMMAAGFWKPKRGAAIRTHPMRLRRARRGELVQIDGSPHDWFEGRAPTCCLLVFIDDATGELMQLQFVDTETTLGYMAAVERYIDCHGLPAAFYSDKHSIFRINAADAHCDAQTQFARALEQLGIEGIQAHSAQAKGRVERANQTLQDRLVKEMRLQGIDSQAGANAWLPLFMADFNRRFAVVPLEQEDAHVAYQGSAEQLQRILSVQEERTLSKNLSCQYDGQLLQVQAVGSGAMMRGAKVCVHTHTDGRRELSWQGRRLAFAHLERPPKQHAAADGKQVNARVDQALQKRGKTIPSDKHPWKKTAAAAIEKQANVVAQFTPSKSNTPSAPPAPA